MYAGPPTLSPDFVSLILPQGLVIRHRCKVLAPLSFQMASSGLPASWWRSSRNLRRPSISLKGLTGDVAQAISSDTDAQLQELKPVLAVDRPLFHADPAEAVAAVVADAASNGSSTPTNAD